MGYAGKPQTDSADSTACTERLTLGCNESVRWEATGGTILQTASQTTNGLHGAYVIIPIFLVLTNELIFG